MKKLLFKIMFLLFVIVLPASVQAGVDIHISIPLPPPIIFPVPPAMVVIPETYVYVVPDFEEEIFFYNGWWWRPWESRWYRSRHYDRGWVHYNRVPSFYTKVHPGWRDDYREHRWRGHHWDYRPIPHHDVERNWDGWQKNKHWEKQQTWGVHGLQPQTRQMHEVKTPGRDYRDVTESRKLSTQSGEVKQNRKTKHQGRP